MNQEDKKDVFICYSSRDKAFVRKLAEDLEAHGVNAWWDEWEMKVGDSITKKIQEGISKSSWLIIVLSPNSIKSNWVEKELSTAQVIEVERQNVFILPILYKTTDIPIFLKDKLVADFRRSYREGFLALIERFLHDLEPQITGELMSEDRSKISSAYSRIPKEKKNKYIHFLIGKLYSTNDSDKLASMTALFTIRYKNLPQYLLSKTGDSSKAVRRRAVFYLGELRQRNAIPVISGLMSDDVDVRATARDAFKKITGKKFIDQ